MLQAIRKAYRATFAPYILWDCHGTKRYCLSMGEAMDWLPYCSDSAAVINRSTRQIEVSRHVKKAY